MEKVHPVIYVDLDGVLADFDTQYFRVFRQPPNRDADEPPDMWDRIRESGRFFRDMFPMPDAYELWRYLEPFNPTVLTGAPPSVPDAAEQKRAWVTAHFGATVPVICCKSRDKCKHMAEPGALLIDDWEKYRHLWLAAGGKWITHRNADSTIDQLLEMGIGL